MSIYKKVNFVINVPDSKYCWDGKVCCEHYDNEGGHSTCALCFDIIDYKTKQYPHKPKECLNLVSTD